MFTVSENLLPPPRFSWKKVLAHLPEPEQDRVMQILKDDEVFALTQDWFFTARREQFAPNWNWFIWMIMAGRGFGKALALDTPIATPFGFTTMGEIKPGAIVFDEKGNPTNVIGTSPIWIGCDCYRVTFSDGNSVICNGDHLWTTEDKPARKALGHTANPQRGPMTRNTRKLKETLYYGKEINHSVLCTEPIRFDDADLLINPYVLGVWLGDGTAREAEIACNDPQIVEEINAFGIETKQRIQKGTGVSYYRLGNNEQKRNATTGCFVSNDSVHSHLYYYGLLNNKHIPIDYLRSSIGQRLQLIQGLMDSDGTINEDGHCEISQKNENLADDVMELCCSLGLKVTKKAHKSKIGNKEYGLRYRICFTPYIPVFRLERKLQYIKPPGNQALRQKRRYIVDIEEVESIPTKCITVDSPSKLYLFGRAFIPTHNNWTGSNWIVNEHQLGGAQNSAIIARTAGDMRRNCISGPSGIMNVAPEAFYPDYKPSLSKLVWPNGTETQLYTADKPEQLRGPNHDRAWCDELSYWRYVDEAWDNLTMTLRFGSDVRCLITMTPRPISRIKRLLEREGRDVAVTRGSTLDNKDNLSGVFIEQIKDEYYGTRHWMQEVEGQFLNDIPGALWNRELLDNNRRSIGAERYRRKVVAVDPSISGGEKANECGIVVAGLGKDKHGYILEDLSLKATPRQWAMAAVRAYFEHEADILVAEKNQGGEMVKETIKSVDDTVNVKLVHASRGKDIRAEPVASLDEQGRIHHVGMFPKMEDEMCLKFNSLIDTLRGNIPISQVKAGDYVRTRSGFNKVKWCAQTGIKRTIKIKTFNKKVLELTDNHKIYTIDRGFIRTDQINRGHKILICNNSKLEQTNSFDPLSNIKENDFFEMIEVITKLAEDIKDMYTSTDLYGRMNEELFQAIASSIIKTKIQKITTYQTLCVLPEEIIKSYTEHLELLHGLRRKYLNLEEKKLSIGNLLLLLAWDAKQKYIQRVKKRGFVETSVVKDTVKEMEISNIKVPVWDMHVERAHEFFANDILVHNCSFVPGEDIQESPNRLDARVWAIHELMLAKRKRAGTWGRRAA